MDGVRCAVSAKLRSSFLLQLIFGGRLWELVLVGHSHNLEITLTMPRNVSLIPA